MRSQCGTSIPEVKKTDNVTVRKTGIGWTFYSFFGIPMICFGMAFGFVGSISEFGIKLGKLFYYFPARKHFKHYKDIKVSLF